MSEKITHIQLDTILWSAYYIARVDIIHKSGKHERLKIK